jgi:predicted PurR-regulated permease PerM
VEKLSTAPLTPEHEQEERPDGLSSAGPIVAIIIATVVLYFAKDILMPLTMALLLAVIFSPIASRLDRFVGTFVSAALVVIAAVTIVVAIGYFVTIELTAVAVQVSDYSDNVATKLTALKGSTPEWLQRVEDGIKDVEQQLNDLGPQSKRAKPAGIVQAPAAPSYLEQAAKPVVPILSALFETLLVVVLMFFLLYGRNDLRDRLVRLAARGRITLSGRGDWDRG